MRQSSFLAASFLALASACAPLPPVAATPTPSAKAAAAVPTSVRWYRASAERRAIFLQTYRDAGAALTRRVAGLAPASWAVILDADETVIDNSAYEQQLAERHATYDETSWNAWVRSEAARDLPGAIMFTRRVHELGGRVVIVTGRDNSYCAATRSNLARVGIVADEVLCRTDPINDSKDPRFDAVARGTAPSTLPPLNVVMWVGDNIQDFPHVTQAIRVQPDEAFKEFGDRFFILPNPIYGSWEKNPLP